MLIYQQLCMHVGTPTLGSRPMVAVEAKEPCTMSLSRRPWRILSSPGGGRGARVAGRLGDIFLIREALGSHFAAEAEQTPSSVWK
jgi:hypothetical protein